MEDAGYVVVYNRTNDVISVIKEDYKQGEQVFLAGNRFGERAPGERKCPLHLLVRQQASCGPARTMSTA